MRSIASAPSRISAASVVMALLLLLGIGAVIPTSRTEWFVHEAWAQEPVDTCPTPCIAGGCPAGQESIGSGFCEESEASAGIEYSCCQANASPPPEATADASVDAGASAKPRRLDPGAGLGDISLQRVIGRFITVLVGVSGSIALLMFVYGGFLWLTSAGEADRVNKGKKVFVWATIGLVVIFGAYAFLDALLTALGASV